MKPEDVLKREATDFQCPHCGIHSMLKRVAISIPFSYTGTTEFKPPKAYSGPALPPIIKCSAKFQHTIWRCVRCGKDTYFLVQTETVPLDLDQLPKTLPQHGTAISPPIPPMTILPKELTEDGIVHQFPIPGSIPNPAIPEPVMAAAIEAEKCLSVGAYNACGTMTRRAIHSLCADKRAEGRDLFAQIKDLKARQLITPDLHEWADSLRVLGRDGAHPEFPEVTAEDAEDGVKLLREIIKYVYILPHERAEKRTKR